MRKNPEYKRIIELEHTADAAIQVSAKDLASLFRYAAEGMYHQIGMQLDTNAKTHKKDLYLSEMDNETLLVTFLTELLFFVENRICYKDFSLEIGEHELKGSLEGYTILSFEREIKAVTFNNLEIRKKDGLFSTQIVFDL